MEQDVFTNFDSYVSDTNEYLCAKMDELIESMQQEKCSEKNFGHWEKEMLVFKNDYLAFQKNVLKYLNEYSNGDVSKIYEIFSQLEDRYDYLGEVYLDKKNSIQDNTLYFERQMVGQNMTTTKIMAVVHQISAKTFVSKIKMKFKK